MLALKVTYKEELGEDFGSKKEVKKPKGDANQAPSAKNAEKAAKKVKKEGEDKKFKADSEKPIVAELHDIVKSRKKKAKCSK